MKTLLPAFRLTESHGTPDTWVERGWPKLVPLVLLPVWAMVLGGAVRVLTGLPLWLGLVVAILAMGGAGWLLWPWLRAERRAFRLRSELVFELAALVPVVFAVTRLFDGHFAGFPNLDGWDGGSHVVLRDSFVSDAPAAYHGFVGFYAVTYFLQKLLRIDALHAFSGAFYLGVIGYAAVPGLLAVAHLRRQPKLGPLKIGLCLMMIVGCALLFLDKLGLPLLHYNQGMGFYPHDFGLLPLLLLWGVDALVRAEALRVAGILLAALLARYCYGLNLPDVLVAAGVVVLVGAPRHGRAVAQGLCAVALALAGWKGYLTLLPVFSLGGGMARFDVDTAVAAHLTIAAMLGLHLFLSRRRLASAGTVLEPAGPDTTLLERGLRFPLIFVLVSSVAWCWIRAQQPPHYYYLTKYPMYASLMLVPACILVVSDWAMSAAAWSLGPSPRASAFTVLRLAFPVLILLVAFRPWAGAYRIYSAGYRERAAAGGPPYRLLRPLGDPEATRRIQQILAQEGKQFGGYLVSFFPQFSFMNASLGHHSGNQEFFPPDTAANRCVFWVGPAEDTLTLGPVAVLRDHRDRLAALPHPPCQIYPVPWKQTPQSLCHHCF